MNIAPLRERKEDIPFLAGHFVGKLAPERVTERSLVLCAGTRLDAGDIKLDMEPRSKSQGAEPFLPEGMTLDQREQSIIREALRRSEGNKSQAARLLGLTRNAPGYRLSKMGM